MWATFVRMRSSKGPHIVATSSPNVRQWSHNIKTIAAATRLNISTDVMKFRKSRDTNGSSESELGMGIEPWNQDKEDPQDQV